MINIKNQELEETINNNEKILVLFSAEFCGPCKALKPNLEKIEEELHESYKFVKIDISEDEENSKKFGIRNIPTVVLIEDKKEKARFIGTRSTKQIKEFIEEHKG